MRKPGPRKPSSRRQKMGERETLTLECTSGSEGSVMHGSSYDFSGHEAEGVGPHGSLNLSMPQNVNHS